VWNTRIFRSLALGLGFFLLASLGGGVPKALGQDTSWAQEEVSRLAREAPSLEQFPGMGGLVLQRRAEYALRADGALEKNERWIVQLTQRTPDSWLHWEIPVPPDGEARVLLAGLYGMPFGNLQSPLIPLQIDREGIPVLQVRVPYQGDRLVLVLEYQQIFPRRFDVGDFLWLQKDLPIWEQEIVARVPREASLYWEGVGVSAPSVESSETQDSYVWRKINNPPWAGAGLVAEGRPSLAFSLRRGILGGLKTLEAYEKQSYPEPEGIFRHIASDSKPHRRGKGLLDELNKNSYLLQDIPSRMVRNGADFPSQGPWTSWERTLLAQSWLRKVGWQVALWWVPVFPLSENVPATQDLWLEPVLECNPPGDTPFLYLFGQTVEYGKTPSSLWGKTLYRVSGLEVQTKRVPEGNLEDHRLTLAWNLSMDARGEAEGFLDLYVRGGWVDLFGEEAARDPEEALRMVEWSVPFSLAGEISKESYAYGYRVHAPLAMKLGIPGSGQVLAKIPGGDLPWIREVLGQTPPFSLRFPFVLEHKLMLRLPENFRMLGKLSTPEISGSIALKGSFYYNKRHNYIEGERKAMVKPTVMDLSRNEIFRSVLQGWERWKTIFVPLKEQ